jgi:hypothetical protein
MQSVARAFIGMIRVVKGRAVAALLTACVVASPAAVRAADPVVEWNEIAVRVTLAAVVNGRTLSPVEQTRAMAIVHVAVHDAVNAVTGRYEQYRRTGDAEAGASAEAAAIAAAYRALLGLFGDAHFGDTAFLTSAYVASLAQHGVTDDDPGLAVGVATADGILALRQADGSASASYPYVPVNAGLPGIWMPLSSAASAQALLPGWGGVTPWVLRKGSQFRPDAPPALDSERYARDYQEIKEVGARVNHSRTDEQTNIALFWRASPIAIWSPILRAALEAHDLDLSLSARIAALVNLAASDASVAVWEAKYFYNYWRPQPAIVNGDADGNPLTEGQADWLPHLPTPAHPEYPSAHAANSAAMAFVMRSFFGDAPGFDIEATSATAAGFVRHWSTFSEGVEEVIDARVYSGIHFRTADEVGARQGRQVARFVLIHALRSAKKR